MLDTTRLYFRLIGAQLRSRLQYKANLVIESIAQFFVTFVDFAGVAVLFHKFPSLQGWSISEVAFLYGTSAVSFTLAQLVVRGFDHFDKYVQMGELDRVLIRPVSPFVQILGVELSLNRLGRLAQGLLVLFIGLGGLTIHWDIAKIGLFVMMLLAGTLIFVAIFVIMAVTTIWTVSTVELTNIFSNGGNYLTSFPMSIYQEWFRNFFIFIVPLGFINYLPTLLILDKRGQSSLPLWLGWLTLPAALIFFGVALAIWNWGLKKYQSTGN
jgi:ABC-2 type transport system permease protein